MPQKPCSDDTANQDLSLQVQRGLRLGDAPTLLPSTNKGMWLKAFFCLLWLLTCCSFPLHPSTGNGGLYKPKLQFVTGCEGEAGWRTKQARCSAAGPSHLSSYRKLVAPSPPPRCHQQGQEAQEEVPKPENPQIQRPLL